MQDTHERCRWVLDEVDTRAGLLADAADHAICRGGGIASRLVDMSSLEEMCAPSFPSRWNDVVDELQSESNERPEGTVLSGFKEKMEDLRLQCHECMILNDRVLKSFKGGCLDEREAIIDIIERTLLVVRPKTRVHEVTPPRPPCADRAR